VPAGGDAVRKRLWIARPKKVGASSTAFLTPEPELNPGTEITWGVPTHTEWREGDAQAIESTPPSELADNGARPGDRGRSVALAAAHDESNRTVVLRESADGEHPHRRSAAAGLSEDARHPLACGCASH